MLFRSPEEGNDESTAKPKGPLAWMTLHPVASNLFMFVLLVGGVLGVLRSKQEVFPEFNLDMVNVTVPYPGASPAEVEQGIVLAVEEGVRSVDGVKRVTSASGEGNATVTIELLQGANANEVLADVKNEVDRIQTFPEEAEEPIVSLAKRRNEVISLVLSGEQELRTLHDVAERVRQRLLTDDRISQVDLDTMALWRVADWVGAFEDDEADDDGAETADAKPVHAVVDLGARSVKVILTEGSQLAEMRVLRLGDGVVGEHVARAHGIDREQARLAAEIGRAHV